MSHDEKIIEQPWRPSAVADFTSGTVLRDYSAPSTGLEISEAIDSATASEIYLRACREKADASPGTRRKWRRQLERRSGDA